MSEFFDCENRFIIITDSLLILVLCILHLVLCLHMRQTDFDNIFDTLDSSPLFDFNINNNCGVKDNIIFHVWGGKEIKNYYRKNGKTHHRTNIVDVSDIEKINGNLFCYKYISYKDLLYNGQIIKKEEFCGDKYPKDCGIIDTLEQHLCIKNNENCPLYDVGIGNPKDTEHYIYDEGNSNVYYNNEIYNDTNKKIIGKLILNDGQPCFRINEKLWRKFDSDEAGREHLQCELEIFGKLTDDRYINKGDITYKKLYLDNLSKDNQDLVMDKIKDEKVSLYKREFLGIDKSCDEKSPLSDEKIEKLNKSQEMEVICLLVELLIMISFFIAVIVAFIKYKCTWYLGRANFEIFFLISVFICLVAILVCIICHSVFLARMINNDVSYECSDKITNEVLRKEKESTHNVIIYTIINLSSDIFAIILNLFFFVLSFFGSKYNREELLLLKI